MTIKKRFIATVMCICIVAGVCWAAVPSEAGHTLVSADTSLAPEYTLNGENKYVYYSDDFSDIDGYQTALGTAKQVRPLTVQNGALIIPEQTPYFSMFTGIYDAAELQNYTVAADFTFVDETKYNGVVAYGSLNSAGTDSYGYEFAVVGGNFRLYRRSVSNKGQLGESLAIKNQFTDYVVGDVIRLSLTAVTNAGNSVSLVCKAIHDGKEKVIYEYTDTDANAITRGAAGLRGEQKGSTVDNLCVARVNDDVMLYTLNGKKVMAHYADRLDTKIGYEEALGSYSDASYKMTHANGEISAVANSLHNALFYGLTDAANMQNYTVGADVTFAGTSSYLSVIAYGEGSNANSSTSGYEFAYVAYPSNRNTKPYFRLAYRNSDNTVKQFGKNNAELYVYVKDVFSEYASGDTIHMSLEAITNVDGSVTLTCYAVHKGVKEVVLTYTDMEAMTAGRNNKGVPGFRTQTTGVTVDNIFVAYAGEDSKTIYADNFDTELGYVEALGGSLGSWKIQNQALVANADTSFVIFNGIENADTLQDYTVSADMAPSATNYATKYNGVVAYGSLNTYGTASYGYEFAINKGQFRLYRRSNQTGGSATLIGETAEYEVTDFFTNYVQGDTVRLALTVTTNDDESVTLSGSAIYKGTERVILEYTDTSDYKITAGTAGIRGNDNSAVIDDVLVARIEESLLPFSETFDNEELIAQRWDNGANATITEDAAVLNGTVDKLYLNGVADAANWKNYVYEADVTLTDTAINSSTTKVAAIVVATTGSSDGYEFGLLHNEKWGWYQVRLINRSNTSDSVSENYTFYLNQSVKLKVEVVGNTMYCYAGDGEEPIITKEVTGVTELTGSIGIRTSGSNAIYDNLTVVPYVENDDDGGGEVPGPNEPETEALPFTEDFEDAQRVKERWDKGDTITITEGAAVLNGAVDKLYLTNLEDATAWTNYVYEADVTLTDIAIGSSATKVAAIVVGTTGSSNGYEFGLLYNEKWGWYEGRLMNRSDTSDSISEKCKFELNKAARLKVEVLGTTIKCYVNNVLVVEKEVENEVTGSIGIRTSGSEAIYDNISVKTYVDNTETAVMPFVENFDNTEKIINRWNNGGIVTIQDETAILDENATNLYLTKVKGAEEWTDYTLEASVLMTETAISSVKSKSAFLVAAANDANKGYEFGIVYNPVVKPNYQVRLYDRVTGTTLATEEYDFLYNVPMQLKMVISDNYIVGYVDGEQVIKYQVKEVTELRGTVGIGVTGNAGQFDDLLVTAFKGKITEDVVKAPTADKNGIYYADDFNTPVYTRDCKWEKQALDISENQTVVSGDIGIQYLTGDAGFYLLEDYAVAAEVSVSAENDIGVRTAVGSVVARTTGSKTGYEFSLCYSEKGNYVRLYDRTTAKELAYNEEVDIELGKQYLLTMVCEGNSITCYLDNEKVLSVVDKSNRAGTAGFRTIGTVYYDDLVVAVPEYASHLGWVSSPSTGDGNKKVLPILWGLATVSLLTAVVVWNQQVKKRSKEEREQQ